MPGVQIAGTAHRDVSRENSEGVGLGRERSRSLTSRRTPLSERLEQATITVTYVAMVDSDLKVRGGGGGGVVKLERKVPVPWLYWSRFWCKMKNTSGGRSYSPPPPPGAYYHCTVQKFLET